MAERRKRMLLHEIEQQCDFALRAYQDAAIALEARRPDQFWYAIQGVLTAGSHLNQLLWPEAAELVPIDSPLAADFPQLSVAFDRWISLHPRGSLRSSNFGPMGVAVADPGGFARFLDRQNSTIILYGYRFAMPALLAAIADLKEWAQVELRHLQEVV
jgi:hypothetical protein